MTMRWWLTGWGILAFLALAAPGLVAVGLFLLLPGLVLVAAPTVFLYSAAFALLRQAMPSAPGPLRNFTAAALALLLGWLVAQPGAIAGRRLFARANLPEVVPATLLNLSGHIRLELPKNWRANRADAPAACHALCAALLDTPGVESVTLVSAGQGSPRTYRLVPRNGDRSRGEFPSRPEAILVDLPDQSELREAGEVRTVPATRKTDEQAVAAAWALRLASTHKLVIEDTPTAAGFTLRIVEDPQYGKDPSVTRVELLDASGRTLLRRSVVRASALAAPFHFGGSGSLESFRVRPGRVQLRHGPEHPPMNPVTELFLHTSLAKPSPAPRAVIGMLERLQTASRNPALPGDDPDFSLAGLWLPTVDWGAPIPPKQLPVLASVIADPRIPVPKKLYQGYEAKVAPELRRALGARILHPETSAATRTQLARLLSKLPSGTFATRTPEENAVLANSELREAAYPLIVRMADAGEAATPELLAILRTHMEIDPWYRRNWVLHALSLAFATLGSEARSALPEVDALVNAKRSRLLNTSDDRERWYLALARMGKPLDEFQWFSPRPESQARDREQLRRRLQRFDPKEVWNY